jgi:hypothetical protein
MGAIEDFTSEKLIIGILTSTPHVMPEMHKALESEFGTTDYFSEALNFEYTHYYDKEMGTPIQRFFLAFEELIDPERLADIKIETNSIEQKYSDKGKRRFNLDPGLLSLDKFVLASTKDNGRRIPLKDGIYAEITLIYIQQEFRSLEWTYPDFATRQYRHILSEIRELYKEQLKRRDR